MTTLTKVLINPQRRAGRRYLTDRQALHAAVRGAFPPDLDDSKGRLLWRLDQRGFENILYIVGPEKPTADGIVENGGWDTRPPQSADYDRFLERLKAGQRWYFELLANPTYSESRGKGKRGKVKAHVTAEAQLEWLRKRAEDAGFSLDSEGPGIANVVERKTFNFNKRMAIPGSKRSQVSIATARFRGALTVTNADALRTTLREGIGRARGYGCGLMTLAPLEELDE